MTSRSLVFHFLHFLLALFAEVKKAKENGGNVKAHIDAALEKAQKLAETSFDKVLTYP